MKQFYLDDYDFSRIMNAVKDYEKDHWKSYDSHAIWKVYALLADLAHTCINSAKTVDRFTFDDLYDLAIDRGYGDPRLTAKDNARYAVECLIQEEQGRDINECECPEDEIFDYLKDHELYFDEDGRLID